MSTKNMPTVAETEPLRPAYCLAEEVNPFFYLGYHSCPSKCRLRVFQPLDDEPGERLPVVAIVSELPDNPGTSVTNRAELLATRVFNTAPNIAARGLVFIEHYPEDPLPGGRKRRAGDPFAERFARVCFEWHSGEARGPAWEYVSLADLQTMGLPIRGGE